MWWNFGELNGLEDHYFFLGEQEKARSFFCSVKVGTELDGYRYTIKYIDGGRAVYSDVSKVDVMNIAFRRIMGCEGEVWQSKYVKPAGTEDHEDWPYTLEVLPLEERTDPWDSESLIIDDPSGLERNYTSAGGEDDQAETASNGPPDLTKKLIPCKDREDGIDFFESVLVREWKPASSKKGKKGKKKKKREFYVSKSNGKLLCRGPSEIVVLNTAWRRVQGLKTATHKTGWEFRQELHPWKESILLRKKPLRWFAEEDLMSPSEVNDDEEPEGGNEETDSLDDDDNNNSDNDDHSGNSASADHEHGGADLNLSSDDEEEIMPRSKPTSAKKRDRRVLEESDDSDEDNDGEGKFDLASDGAKEDTPKVCDVLAKKLPRRGARRAIF